MCLCVFPPVKISVTLVNRNSSSDFLDTISERLIFMSLVYDPLKLLNYSKTVELLKDKTVLTFFVPPVSNMVPSIFLRSPDKDVY